VKGTPKPTKAMPSPMSFPNNAKTVAGADKDRGGCPSCTNDSGAAATQTKKDAEDDEDEDVLLCIPRSFRFKD
jgi:hypothetical protein